MLAELEHTSSNLFLSMAKVKLFWQNILIDLNAEIDEIMKI